MSRQGRKLMRLGGLVPPPQTAYLAQWLFPKSFKYISMKNREHLKKETIRAMKIERERIIYALWEWVTSEDPQPRGFNTKEELREYLES